MIYPLYFTESHMPEMNRTVADFVSVQCFGVPGEFEKFASMGVFSDARLIGGVVYHEWQPDAGVMQLSAAGVTPKWLAPQVIRAMFDFPFRWNGAQMVVLRVSERNERMVSIARRFGFEGIRVPRLRGRDEAEWLFTMTDDAWAAHPVALRGKRG